MAGRRWPLRRSTSLRTRVAIAAALSAAAVVAVFAVLTSVLLVNNDAAQLDRRLDSIIDTSIDADQAHNPQSGILTTIRAQRTGEVVFQRGFQLPPLPEGTSTVAVNGIDYRVRTIAQHTQGQDVLISIGIRVDSILMDRGRVPLYLLIGLTAVLLAAVLGWLLAGPAIRPLRKLTEHTQRLGDEVDELPEVHGVREAEELSDAMSDMLRRLAAAQAATAASLQAAQDFAANAAHELRTPLTAMRADLDTLRIHDLPDDERDEVVADLARAQRRIEALITALGQLASGQLARAEDREPVDVEELLERVARETARPGVTIAIDAENAGTVWGWPGGLRLAVDNLVRNAIAHGRATRIELTARRAGDTVVIDVDDNGRGLPAEERREVLGRFARGSTAAPGGTGLGLALVAQQAALHGGTVTLCDGPLGGLRARLTVSAAPDQRA
ncbi:HAMP domain-containing histidine kinase [Mycobacterium sp. MYCO198283]|uniref:sensor histidine kinase n=1 Tax=Mycobacterium sp. MYCO198283 TaxID=2883505 RepID=UPI001E3F9A71|nr:HAMP domain-containing sensor histidine kinase [Mycobacterium sp. MYCO198283]MCG5431995.1 HAMP domain-containing histidine kinase [Mycobacterium sp. MYCO198283]